MTDGAPERLWVTPSERIEQAAITRYLCWLRDERGLRFSRYEDLWRWSVDELEAFWSSIWDFTGVISHSPYERVLDRRVMPGARWFDGATVNYAEQSLWRALGPEWALRTALVFESESRPRIELTWGDLGAQVGALAATLRRLGVEQGDRVVAYLPNAIVNGERRSPASPSLVRCDMSDTTDSGALTHWEDHLAPLALTPRPSLTLTSSRDQRYRASPGPRAVFADWRRHICRLSITFCSGVEPADFQA